MKADKVLAEIKEAVKKSMAYDELNRKFQLITNKSADEVLQRLTQTGLPSNDTQNVRGLPKLALLHELAKFYPDTPEGLGITLDAKFTGIGSVEYNRKVKIPQFVAEYITIALRNNRSSGEIMCSFATSSVGKEIDAWFYDKNINTLFDALAYGYEVEEEPKYYVAFPGLKWNEDKAELETKNMYLLHDVTSDETNFSHTAVRFRDFVPELTERTIKAIDERYWSFAVPVEEVNHG